MDYIDGFVLHDDGRRARLENAAPESIEFAVVLTRDALLHVIANARAQILHDIEAGHIALNDG